MDREDSPAEIHQYLRDGKARSLALLQQAVRGLEEELGMVAEIGSPAGPARRSAPRSIPAETPDKDDFVQKAPPYYELAVASYFDETSVDFFTVEALLGRFSTMYDILPIGVLLDHALAALREKNMVVEVPDDFGPTLYRKSPNFGAIWHGQKQPTPLFRKFYEMGNEQQRWLRGALSKINEQYAELGLTEQDFTQSTLDDKWEPIPLDRSDQRLQKATEALDEALEKIESSNGYAAEVPGERQYVLQSLKAGSRTLKESAQIYWVELKVFVLEPLGRVIKRFGTAVEGVAASAARDAFHDWLKIAFSKALEWWPF
jgi:hypothetical protein